PFKVLQPPVGGGAGTAETGGSIARVKMPECRSLAHQGQLIAGQRLVWHVRGGKLMAGWRRIAGCRGHSISPLSGGALALQPQGDSFAEDGSDAPDSLLAAQGFIIG